MSEQATKMEINKPLDDLQLMVRDAKKVLLSNDVRVDPVKLQNYVDQINRLLPDQIRKADEIIAKEQEILTTTQEAAAQMRSSAEAYSKTKHQEADDYAAQTKSAADANSRNTIEAANRYKAETEAKAKQDADAAIAEANQQAAQIVEAARVRAAQMVDQSQIVMQAQQKAQEICEAANRFSEETRQRTVDTVVHMLDEADTTLNLQVNNMRQMRQEILSGN